MMQKRRDRDPLIVHMNMYNIQGVGRSNAREAANPQQSSRPQTFSVSSQAMGKALLLNLYLP